MSATEQAQHRHVYDLVTPGPPPAVACSARLDQRSSGALCGVSVEGARASVALLQARRGAGCAVQVSAAEKFFFVLEGALTADLDGRLHEVPAQHALHVPAGMPHALRAAGDTRFILALSRNAAAVTGVFDDAGWVEHANAVTQPVTRQSGDAVTRYVYPIDELNAVPPGESSAKVVPKNFVSGKSSSFGAALSGAALHVGVIHKARGSGAKLHTHPNEHFNVVLEGRLLGEIATVPMDVAPYGLVHMPAGVPHCTMASADGDIAVFVVKDTSHGLSGPPVDGIEDGPRYLPGFGPRAGV